MELSKQENFKTRKSLNLKIVFTPFLFGIFDFHYQSTISPVLGGLQRLLGIDEGVVLLLLPLLFLYMLTPWYALSLYVLKINERNRKFGIKELVKKTILAYLIAVFSYYLHYVFLLFFVGLPNFENIRMTFSEENIKYALNTLFLPGIVEWGIGAVILGVIVAMFNYKILPIIIGFVKNTFPKTRN